MGEFKPIETQEELDRIIKERLDRQKDTILKNYENYEGLKKQVEELTKNLSDANATIESKKDLEKTIEELTGKVKFQELNSLRIKYALENGIPHNLASRISGDDEESIKADAESLSDFFKSQTQLPPLKTNEKNVDSKVEGYKNLLNGIKGE